MQFAVTKPKPVYEEGVDYRLALVLAVFSMSFISVLLSRIISSTDPKLKIVKQTSTAIARVEEVVVRPENLDKVSLEAELFKKLVSCGEISKYLNILRVELEYLRCNNLDRIALLEKMLSIFNGTDPEVKFFDKPCDIRNLYEELKVLRKAYRDTSNYLENNSVVRLDIKLLYGLLDFPNIKLEAENVLNLVELYRCKVKGVEYNSKKKISFHEMAVDIKYIISDLISEKYLFQSRFQAKMKASFKEFKMSDSIAR